MLESSTRLPALGADDHGRYGTLAGAEQEIATLMLDADGMVCDCSDASEILFGYPRRELVWHPVSMVLPQLKAWELMANGQPNPQLRFLCRIGRHFLALTQEGEQFAVELIFNLLNSTGRPELNLIVRPVSSHPGLLRGERP